MSIVSNLTSKNKQDYESAASHIISCADVEAFKELVSKVDLLSVWKKLLIRIII